MTSASRRHEIALSTSHCTILPSNTMFQDSERMCPGVHTNDEAVCKIKVLLTRGRPLVQVTPKSSSMFWVSLFPQFVSFSPRLEKNRRKKCIPTQYICVLCIPIHIHKYMHPHIFHTYIYMHVHIHAHTNTSYMYSLYVFMYTLCIRIFFFF